MINWTRKNPHRGYFGEGSMFIGEQTLISHEEIHITYAIIWEWSSFFVVLLELISNGLQFAVLVKHEA